MQRLNLPVESLDESEIARPSESSPPRLNGTIVPSPKGVATVDMSKSYSMEKGRRLKRFQGDICVHSIPLILILCYLCLWIASSETVHSEDLAAFSHQTSVPGPAPLALSGIQVEAPAYGNRSFIDDNLNVNASEEPA